MIKYLINLGLVLTPFVVVKGMDMRTPKEIIALGVALTIGLVSFYKGSLKPFKNIWLLIFIGFMLVSLWMAPRIDGLMLSYHQVTRIDFLPLRSTMEFMFKPVLYALVYTILLIAVSSYSWTKKEVRQILLIMASCGFVMSLYIFIQALGLDQFFAKVTTDVNPDVLALDQPLLGGFIGHSTTVSPFIAMLIPMAIYLRKWMFALCMAGAVFLTESKMAMGGMVGGLLICGLVSSRIYKILVIIIVILLFLGAIYGLTQYTVAEILDQATRHDNGRIEIWKDIWKTFTAQIRGRRYTITGWGPGAFHYRYSIKNGSRWWQVHNEPFEALVNFGIIGLGLLIMGVIHMVKQVKRQKITYFLCASLGCIFLCSLGTFPFQLAPTMFYTVIIIGLLHNENIGGEDAKT